MWLNIQIFGFRALWSPYFFLFVLFLSLIYFLVTGPYRHKFTNAARVTRGQQIYFYVGMMLLYIIKGSPIDLMSHIMLSAHMAQLAVFYLIFPILIIKGIPNWMWEKFIALPVIKPVFKIITMPLVAMLLFNGLFSLFHMPAIFDFSKSSQVAHTGISLVILVTAFAMWWPVVVPIKRLDKLNPLLKIGYIFANGALITPACALIIFAGDPLFKAYSSEGIWMQAMALCVPSDVLDGLAPTISGAEMFSPLSTVEDQQTGGIIMQTLIQIIYGTMIGRVFFNWFSKRSLAIDPLPSEPGASLSQQDF